jgi:CTP:molybdopterin cytidylyltransferase MocA
MGTPKAELVVDSERLVDRAVRVLHAAGCRRVFAVVREGTAVPNAQVVVNPEPDRGLGSSLILAVEAASRQGPPDALAVLLVDLPGVGPDAVRSVIGGWRPGRIAMASYQGRRGHPIVMAPARWQEAIALAEPDEGARRLLAARPDLVDEVDVAGDPSDLDTPEDLRRWAAR